MLNKNSTKLMKYEFYYKNHPAVNIDLKTFKDINIKNINFEISKCFEKTKKSIFIFSSSAILDAIKHKHEYCLYISEDTINFSPTKGLKNIKKIFDIDDVLKFLD